MKQYEEVFFGVLRTALWKKPLEIPEGFRNWKQVLGMAKAQTMKGLVGDVILTTPSILASLPTAVVQKLQEIPLNNMASHTTLNNTLILAVTALRGQGIEPVLLKGQGLAIYYPVPQLRQCGDIDLYVGPDNYEKTYEVLSSLPGLTEIDEKEVIWKEIKHFHVRVGAVLIEVHRFADVNYSPRLDRIYQSYADEGLTHNLVPVDFAGTSVMTPADDFNVYYIFNHLWHHFLNGGIGLRQLCDLAVFLDTHEVNEEYLRNILEQMQVMKAWQVIGSILVDYLGLPKEKLPFHVPVSGRKQAKIMKRILVEGNFGHNSTFGRKRSDNYFKEKVISFSYHMKRYFAILPIFPGLVLRQSAHTLIAGFRQVFKDILPAK